MGIAFRVLVDVGCTVSVWDGEVTAAEARDHVVQLADSADWPPGPLHLTDVSTLRRGVIPDADLVGLLYEGTRLTADLKVAVLVAAGALPTNDLRFKAATAALFATAFDDLDAACAYLGVPHRTIAATLAELRAALR